MCFFKRMNKKERNCIYKCERAELVIGDLLWLSSSCLICASRVSVSPTIQNLCPVFVCVCCACPRLLVLNGRKLYCEMTGDDVELCIRYATMRSLSPISLSVSPIFVLPGFQKPRPGEALTVQNKATVAIPSAVCTSSVDRRPVTQAAAGCSSSTVGGAGGVPALRSWRHFFPPSPLQHDGVSPLCQGRAAAAAGLRALGNPSTVKILVDDLRRSPAEARSIVSDH